MLVRQGVRTLILCRRGLSLLATASQPKPVCGERGDLRFAINSLQTRKYIKAETMMQVMPPKQQTYKDIEERVLKAVRAWDRFPQDRADKLDLNADFAKDLGMDSLDHVEMMLAVEAEFDMEIGEDTVEKFTSPRKIYDFMCERFDVYK